ncbi:pur operon repressor [Massilibacterium senegalense]|uniref:pur operon repressor n=1 Tax=Massilibacterium senegalense TaxID=1632858 RepID=UPI000781F255|nr:pur operon repressor [Massilibacterium senegalense]
MKMRRSGRLVDMTCYLLQHPHELISLTFFSERYEAAKSSISEDLGIIKTNFETQGIGSLITIAGAAGGVKYIPLMSEEESNEVIQVLSEKLEDPERLLPGGYLYLTDLLGDPKLMNRAGRLLASFFANQDIEYVMTVATKGIPLAYTVASYLDVPMVIVRRDNKVTEGSTVSINYVSGSTKRIQTMVLARRSLPQGSNVLIIDDFMKAGGTIQGMVNLLEEFNANVCGIGVLVEADSEDADVEERLVDDYISLVKLEKVDVKKKEISAVPGNVLQHYEKLLDRTK